MKATRTPPISFPVAVSASGDTAIIPAAPEGFAWLVLGWKLTSDDVVTVAVKLDDKTISTSYATNVAAGGEVLPASREWGFPLLHQAAVNLNLSASKHVGGHVSAELVPFPNADKPVLLFNGEQLTFDFLNLIYK